MRYAIFLVLMLCVCTIGPVQSRPTTAPLSSDSTIRYQAKPLDNADPRLLRLFDVEEDRFRNQIRIEHKSARKIPYPRFYPEIVISDGYIELRLVTVYLGDSWIFFDNVQVLVDDEKFEFSVQSTNRQVVSGGVVERSKNSVDEYLLDMLNKIVLSEYGVEYRLSGEYYEDRSISRRELRVIQDTFDLVNSLIVD